MNKEDKFINRILLVHYVTSVFSSLAIVFNLLIIVLHLRNFRSFGDIYVFYIFYWLILITVIHFFIFIYKFFRENEKEIKLRYRNLAFLFVNNTQIFIPIILLTTVGYIDDIVEDHMNLVFIHIAFFLVNFLVYRKLFKNDFLGKKIFGKFFIIFLIYSMLIISIFLLDLFVPRIYYI